ncbi:MAG TPA: SRPBCC domain-containing protein [Candidatus Dormibacteraeota bacterium]|nr:SRPBCC domain-containing protein [Candidatus Dormibacteraeota bacterium]
MIEPLRISFEVACGVDHAFSTWTARTSAWWPRAATMSGEADVDVVFEPRVGGRVFERTAGGREFVWGEVTAWEPPRRIGYLWHIATDRDSATDVEIVFVEVATTTTRVDIEHRGWERLGAERAQPWRDANRAGWDGVLPAFIQACAGSGSA